MCRQRRRPGPHLHTACLNSLCGCPTSTHPAAAVIQGAAGTPYANGRFRLRLSMPQRYPFEPPKVQLHAHPKVDTRS